MIDVSFLIDMHHDLCGFREKLPTDNSLPIALLVYLQYNGRLLRSNSRGRVHYFNKLNIRSFWKEVDVSGIDPDKNPIRISINGHLWENAEEVPITSIPLESWREAFHVAKDSGISTLCLLNWLVNMRATFHEFDT